MDSLGVWKHLRYDDGPINDTTHVFYTKLVQSGGVVQTPDKVQAFLKRWSFAASFLMKVEDTISRVAAKIGSIQQELQETEVVLAELEGMLDANVEAQRRVEENIHEIASAFKTIVAYLEPMMKWDDLEALSWCLRTSSLPLQGFGVKAESATQNRLPEFKFHRCCWFEKKGHMLF